MLRFSGSCVRTIVKFPNDVKRKVVWVKLMGNSLEWMPTSSLRVCSKHFEEGSYSASKCGRRILNPNAIPTLYLSENLNVADKNIQTEVTIDTFEKPFRYEVAMLEMDVEFELSSSPRPSISHSLLSETSHSIALQSDSGNSDEEYVSIYKKDSPRIKKMKSEIHRITIIAEKRRKTMKRLQQSNRRQTKDQ